MIDSDHLVDCHAIILAGGFGTRLQARVPDTPKVLAPLWGNPFLAHQLKWLEEQGIFKVSLAVHYRAAQIREFVNNLPQKKLMVDCIYESEPLGTGGAVANVICQKNLEGLIFVLNGDTLCQFSIAVAAASFLASNAAGLIISMRKESVARYGTITLSRKRIVSFNQATGLNHAGIVSAGAYFFDATCFDEQEIRPFSLEYDLFPSLVKRNALIAHVVDDDVGFVDIGTTWSYDRVQKMGK